MIQNNYSGEELTLNEIKEIGMTYEILSLDKFTRKVDLIRTIQLAAGKADCFKLDPTCSERKCIWIRECLSNKFD